MAKKTVESTESMMKILVTRMAKLRAEKDSIDAQIEEVKGELLPLMMATGTQNIDIGGVGKVVFVKGGESVSLNKGKLQGNLLKYLDAEDVATVIEASSTTVTKKPYIQFTPA